MKYVQLNPEGNFDQWDIEKIKELNDENRIGDSLGQKLLYENGSSRLWDITLWPKQRIPFRKHLFPCSFVCLTSGLAISRCKSGIIKLIQIEKGDTEYMEPDNANYIHDLENIGDSILKMYVLEFRYESQARVELNH
ncbi:MAG: hypothetical protein AAFY00_06395 [Bacteroidota bacterium]